MNTIQLQTFVSLAETLNYHRSGEQLQYSPSTLFKHIKMLEEEIGPELFCKKGRNLELTDAGRRFIRPARELLRYQEEAIRLVKGEEGCQPLRIGGAELIAAYAATPLLTALQEAFPAMRAELEHTTNAAAAEDVRRGTVDAAFCCRTAPGALNGLYSVPFNSAPVCVVTAPDSPIAARGELHAADLAELPIIDTEADGCLTAALIAWLRGQDLTPGPVLVAGTLQRAVRRLMEEQALMVVPRTALPRLCSEYPLRELHPEEPLPRCILLLLTAETPSPAAEVLADLTLRRADEPAPD